MATGRAGEVIRCVGRGAFLREWAGRTDRELLDCFVRRREKAAIEVLVRRHGPLVWGVCRRVLHNFHDAEDAFQATFLVLVRRAASIASRDLLANWLYGVARQTALKARAAAAKRGRHERQAADVPEPAAPTHDPGDDLPAVLDHELSRLPEKYRAVILQCDLGGLTRREAAERLGVPEGTVGSRQVRGRAMLAKRLARRGVSCLVVVPPAAVPAKLMLSTATAATAGKSVPATVTALAEGVIKAMHFTKVVCVGTLLALAVVAGGSALLAGPAFRARPPDPQTPRPAGLARNDTTAKDAGERTGDVKKEDETAWGEAAGGLQAGVAIKGGRRAHRIGDVVPLVVRLRNVTDKALAFDYSDGFFVENPPTVTDADGKPAKLSEFPILAGLWRRLHLSLAAGETVEFGSLDLALAPADAKNRIGRPTLFASPGVYRIRYERLPPLRESDPTKVLSTGALDLEVKEAERPGEAKGDLEGSWQAVSFEQDGRTPRGVNVKEVAATFEGDKYRFSTGMRVQGAEKGTLAVHPDTDPKTFEFTPESGVFKGQAFRGIYRLEGEKLTLCFSWPVKDRPAEFASPPDSTVVLAGFERRKP